MEQAILFAFLALFPFGQIIGLGIIHPIDVVVGIAFIYTLLKKFPKPAVFKYFTPFILVATFSWILGAINFNRPEVFIGSLYLFRLVAYFYFVIFVFNLKNKIKLPKYLLTVVVFTALFGWIQYFLYPDTRSLYWLGWDDHLFRMIGTFLDPTYLGLILVFGLIGFIGKKKSFGSILMLLTIALTYSRASFLAAIAVLAYKKKWILLGIFTLVIFLLPRPAGEGVKLERVSSISARFENYKETFEIFKTNPLFGVGYNNICLAKSSDFSSHSCSGSDSSFLFILATTGIVGLIAFIYLIYGLWLNLGNNVFPYFLALVIHSFFSNSLFYPWVMGYFAILIGIFLGREEKR